MSANTPHLRLNKGGSMRLAEISPLNHLLTIHIRYTDVSRICLSIPECERRGVAWLLSFGQIVGNVTKNAGSGSYLVSYRAERVLFDTDASLRAYRIDVTLLGIPIQGSPFYPVLIPGPPVAATSILNTNQGLRVADGSLLSTTAGLGTDLLLQTRDAYNNDAQYENFGAAVNINAHLEGQPALSVAGIGTANGLVLRCSVTDFGNGRYILGYNATVAGEYLLFVSINGDVIDQGVPKRLTISPAGNAPAMFVFEGAGVTSDATVFRTTFFTLQCRDAFGNPRRDDGALASPNAAAYIQVVMDLEQGSVRSNNLVVSRVDRVSVIWSRDSPGANLTNGTYVVRFTVSKPGTLRTRVVYVTDSETVTPVNADAFAARVLPAEMTTARLYGPLLEGVTSLATQLVPVSTPDIYFYLEPLDAGGNPALMPPDVDDFGDFTVNVFPAATVTLSRPALGADNFTWEARFRISVQGEVSVQVLWRDAPVIGSPASLFVRPSMSFMNPVNSYAVGAGLTTAVAGEMATFLVQMRDDDNEMYALSKNRYNRSQARLVCARAGRLNNRENVTTT